MADDYEQEDYMSYEPSDDVVYQDDKIMITYESVMDNTACFMVQNLSNERFDVSGSKISIDGEYQDNMSSATVYPGNMRMMAIDDVEVESGMTMMISFSIKDSNGSRYSTDTYSVDL
jgi:ectoine hydroxylase-related dioxygenase (phytanoyl-CoA dioxygenase family)